VQNWEIMDEDFTKKLILNLLKSMESRISGDLWIITQYFGESNAEDYCYALDEEEKEVVYFNNINQCSEYLNWYWHSSYSYEKNIIKEADLPMFYLEKIDYNWNYSLSFTKDYLLSPVW
jgi:hypothetical protein